MKSLTFALAIILVVAEVLLPNSKVSAATSGYTFSCPIESSAEQTHSRYNVLLAIDVSRSTEHRNLYAQRNEQVKAILETLYGVALATGIDINLQLVSFSDRVTLLSESLELRRTIRGYNIVSDSDALNELLDEIEQMTYFPRGTSYTELFEYMYTHPALSNPGAGEKSIILMIGDLTFEENEPGTDPAVLHIENIRGLWEREASTKAIEHYFFALGPRSRTAARDWEDNFFQVNNTPPNPHGFVYAVDKPTSAEAIRSIFRYDLDLLSRPDETLVQITPNLTSINVVLLKDQPSETRKANTATTPADFSEAYNLDLHTLLEFNKSLTASTSLSPDRDLYLPTYLLTTDLKQTPAQLTSKPDRYYEVWNISHDLGTASNLSFLPQGQNRDDTYYSIIEHPSLYRISISHSMATTSSVLRLRAELHGNLNAEGLRVTHNARNLEITWEESAAEEGIFYAEFIPKQFDAKRGSFDFTVSAQSGESNLFSATCSVVIYEQVVFPEPIISPRDPLPSTNFSYGFIGIQGLDPNLKWVLHLETTPLPINLAAETAAIAGQKFLVVELETNKNGFTETLTCTEIDGALQVRLFLEGYSADQLVTTYNRTDEISCDCIAPVLQHAFPPWLVLLLIILLSVVVNLAISKLFFHHTSLQLFKSTTVLLILFSVILLLRYVNSVPQVFTDVLAPPVANFWNAIYVLLINQLVNIWRQRRKSADDESQKDTCLTASFWIVACLICLGFIVSISQACEIQWFISSAIQFMAEMAR